MRRALAILLSVLVFAVELPAQTNRGWERVEKLKSGTPVLIFLWNGDQLKGDVETVNSAELQFIRRGLPSTVACSKVRKIVRVRRTDLPDPRQWMVTGALVGAAIGGTWGAVRDAQQHSNEGHWFTGALGGAVLGFFGSCAALTGVGVASVFRHNKVVYEEKTHGPGKTGDQSIVGLTQAE